ncbi:6220_t:CDS:1, partial [Funneliformis caledonium]
WIHIRDTDMRSKGASITEDIFCECYNVCSIHTSSYTAEES